MKSSLRLLHLEDNPIDADLIRWTLLTEWPECQFVTVDNQAGFLDALNQGGFDLILGDYSMPSFDGLSALSLARQQCPETPFIFVSGVIGEEVAVEALKIGATDYVIKDRLARLVPAVRRAFKESEERVKRRQAEDRLRQSEEEYRDLFENATDLIQSITPEGRFLYVNRAWRETLGYTESETDGLTIFNVVHPEYHDQCRERFQRVRKGEELGTFEAIFLTKYGCHIYVEGSINYRFQAGELAAIRGIFRDVTEKRLSEVTLKRSMREFEALVNSIDGIVWQADASTLRFTFVSQQAERLLGYPVRCWVEEAEFWQNHIHPEDRERAVSLCTQLTAEQKYQSFEYRMLAPDGRVVWLRDIVSVRMDPGESPRIQGIMVDITARKQAEVARQQSDALKGAILEAALDCIIVSDHDGRIIEFNPAAEKTFGYPHTAIMGQSMAEKLVPPAIRERHSQDMNRYLASGEGPLFGKRIEITGLRADGSEFPAEVAIVPLRLAEHPVFTAYVRDITERKLADDKVRRIQAKLEQTNQDLLRKNQEIQNFYHTLSHELKTPLTSAREFIAIVMDGLAGPVNETQLEYLGIAKESCNQLRFCINDLLDATRLETGKLSIELKPIAFSTLVQWVVSVMAPVAAEKKIVVSQEVQPDLPDVPLDETRMKQIITNLLNNALKFTPVGGSVLIKAGDAPGRPELLQISVSDTGCGIPKKEQDRIFDRLYQIKAGDATTEQGIGLGLYLCRELVQLHGGTIWVESEPGKGSTFAFLVPKSQGTLQSNLLIIDDDREILDTLGDVLGREGYNVRAAAGGIAGLELMRQQTPDIVLLDLAMPELDGPSTLKEIRKNWGALPVIVHTGYADSTLMKQALAFSPFTLLAKPCSADQLIETVRKVQRAGDTAIWKKNHYGLQKPRAKES